MISASWELARRPANVVLRWTGRSPWATSPRPSGPSGRCPSLSVTRRLEEHLAVHVGPGPDALMFTASKGGPLFRSTFARDVWHAAVTRAGLDGVTFPGLRHSFVAILVAAGCNAREVSEWAGHNSVAFTLTRYGGDRVDLVAPTGFEPALPP
jgi:integrase